MLRRKKVAQKRLKLKLFVYLCGRYAARMVELVDTRDLKSLGLKRPYGFDSRFEHHETPNNCHHEETVSPLRLQGYALRAFCFYRPDTNAGTDSTSLHHTL